jgi:hypothetical protein
VTAAVYLIGPPGVGKTSLMETVKEPYLEADAHRAWPGSLLWLIDLYNPHDSTGPEAVELGRRRGTFSGTDALGMAVMPHAVDWLVNTRSLPALVFGEGARLGTLAFLRLLDERVDHRLTVVHLTADPDGLKVRRAERGSNQDPSWMRGAETRAANAAKGLAANDVRVVRLDASEASPIQLRDKIMERQR